MTRRLLWAALVLAPVAIAVRFVVAEPAVVFPIAAAALVPLAWLVSRATEEAAQHTGPAGGLRRVAGCRRDRSPGLVLVAGYLVAATAFWSPSRLE